MKLKNKFIPGMLALTALAMGGACTKGFEDYNRLYNTVSVADATPAAFFNNLSMRFTTEDHTFYTCVLMPYANQQGVQNVTVPYTNYSSSYWNNYYPDLADYKQLMKLIAASASPDTYTNLKAMATILISHKTLQMLDRYGDIPYTQASLASDGPEKYRPVYDDQASVYKSVLADLATAVNSIKTGAAANTQVALGAYETFLGSDYDSWIKFGNSIRLRYAVRLYTKEQTLATGIITDIVGGNKPLPNDQAYANNMTNLRKNNYGSYPQLITPIPSLPDKLFYSYRETSVSNIRLSTNVWNQISSTNADDGSGIFDPRAWVWFMPNNLGKWVPQPQDKSIAEGTSNIYPSATVPYAMGDPKVADNKFAGFNFYLVRDYLAYPFVVLSEADVHFLKAEIYTKGMGVTADFTKANAEYTAALTASVNYWYSYVGSSTGAIWPASKPALGPSTIATFLANPKVALVSGDNTGNLQKIITQAWLSTMFNAPEAWALSRRTGMTPKSSTYTSPVWNKMPYPTDESVNNRDNWMKAGGGAAPDAEAAKKVYWMP